MSGRWLRGETEIEQLLAERHLERVVGGQADGTPWMTRARQVLATAQLALESDPGSSYVLAYDAARQACAGLLAQQGLRPTSRGGHIAVDEAMRAQFGAHFSGFGVLRKRRNELEYPEYPDVVVEKDEAVEALATATAMVDAAARLQLELGFF
jgi:hypothetical protein